MALLMWGHSVCALCHVPLKPEDHIFATSGVAFSPPHELYPYCDAPFHWECYAQWPQRIEFASGYFRIWVQDESRDVYWSKAYLSESILVLVNPDPDIAEARLCLAETASKVLVELKDWSSWVSRPAAAHRSLHVLEMEILEREMDVLRSTFPDSVALVASLDLETKRVLHLQNEAVRLAERSRQLENLGLYNKACATMKHILDETGLQCPQCHCHSRAHRYINNRKKGARSFFVCEKCGGSFGPHSMSPN